ncbi:putative amidohydrolase YtcJ [Nitrobacteraceae bacterium AZCC 1564]
MTESSTSLRLLNGRIYRSAYDQSPAEALLVRNDKIAWVGAEDDAPAADRTFDLKGATVIPGLTDPHIHLFAIANARLLVPLGQQHASSIGDVLDRLATRARSEPKGNWVQGVDFDENNLAEHRYPTRDEIDAAVPDHPVMIRRFCGHIAILNSAALRNLGFDEGLSNPEGGVFGRFPDGRLDGSAIESAAEMAFRAMPRTDRAVLAEALRHTIDDCLRMGMTAAVEAAVGFTSGFDEEFAIWQLLRRNQPHPPVRLGFMLQLDPEEAAERGLSPGLDPDWQCATLKYFADGIVGGRTAAVSEEYCDTPTRGFFMRDEADLERVIIEAHRGGWQVAVHAVGDRAISHVIGAYEKAQQAAPRDHARHRIEHFFCPPADGFERMKRLGGVIVMQPSFLTRMRRSILNGFGERAHRNYPGRSALDAGVNYAGSSDAPTGLTSPWAGIADAVDRGAAGGDPIGPGEALTVRQAISSYTHGGAYAMKQENWRGALEPGMAADLIALDCDPFTAINPDLRNTNVMMTMVRGQVHHDAIGQTSAATAAASA